MITGPAPSNKALASVGKTIVWSEGDNDPIEVLVIGAERTYSIIRDKDGNEWPGVRFYIKLPNGRRRWTCTFADEVTP